MSSETPAFSPSLSSGLGSVDGLITAKHSHYRRRTATAQQTLLLPGLELRRSVELQGLFSLRVPSSPRFLLPGSAVPRLPVPGCLFLVSPLPDSALAFVFLPWISSSCPLGLFCRGLDVLWSFSLWVSFLGFVLVVGPQQLLKLCLAHLQPSFSSQGLTGDPTWDSGSFCVGFCSPPLAQRFLLLGIPDSGL